MMLDRVVPSVRDAERWSDLGPKAQSWIDGFEDRIDAMVMHAGAR
jgi:hypothetical protein